ncbi:MAG: hypothetical protein ACFE0Q_03480 [Anaerolineae bacterium]
MTHPTPHTDEVDIASPQEQRQAIESAIREYLGDEWQREWLLVHDANDLVRLNRGDKNLDFQADLLAQVEIIEREANPLQLSGRMIALMVLGLFLFIAFMIASLAGVLG